MKKPAKRFAVGDEVVHRHMGIGRIVSDETMTIEGKDLTLHVISVRDGKLTLKVPAERAESSGLRRPSSPDEARAALAVLGERPRRLPGTWSRRGREFEVKIGSGSLVSMAEAIRDLNVIPRGQDASYSERTLHDDASMRFAAEIASSLGISPDDASRLMQETISAAPRRAGQGEAEGAAQDG